MKFWQKLQLWQALDWTLYLLMCLALQLAAVEN